MPSGMTSGLSIPAAEPDPRSGANKGQALPTQSPRKHSYRGGCAIRRNIECLNRRVLFIAYGNMDGVAPKPCGCALTKGVALGFGPWPLSIEAACFNTNDSESR